MPRCYAHYSEEEEYDSEVNYIYTYHYAEDMNFDLIDSVWYTSPVDYGGEVVFVTFLSFFYKYPQYNYIIILPGDTPEREAERLFDGIMKAIQFEVGDVLESPNKEETMRESFAAAMRAISNMSSDIERLGGEYMQDVVYVNESNY